MKRQAATLIACLLGMGGAMAQEPALYECIYQYDIHGTDPSGAPFTETGHTALQIGATQAKFQDYTAFGLDSLDACEGVSEELRQEYSLHLLKNACFFDQTVYQNVPQGQMTIQSVITPDYYVYRETSSPIRWTLHAESDTICGYACRKATGTYGGRAWTAWYATDIPVPFGPWKLTGLPGLVMDATDDGHVHHFTAIAFRRGASVLVPLPERSMISTTRDKFVQAKNRFEKDPLKNLPVEAISEMTVQNLGGGAQDKAITINDVPLRLHPHGYTPLEIQ